MFVLQSLAYIAISLLVAFYANFLWKRRRLYELANKLPQRKGLPFVGLLHKFIFRSYKDYLEVVSEIPDESEPLTAIWMGPFLAIFINSPEYLQIVLNSPKSQKKPSVFYDVWQCEQGLVLSHGPLWKNHRKIFNSSFTLNVLQEMLPMFNDKSKKSIKLMDKNVNGKTFDIYEVVAAASLETLMKGNFNFDRDYQSDPHNEALLLTVEKGREIMMRRTFQLWNNYEPIFKYICTKLYKEVNGVISDIKSTSVEVVAENKKLGSNLRVEATESDEENNSRRTIIEALLDKKNNFSQKEIIDEISTFIIAGHETTAATISSALLMLAMHKDMQQKVIEEIDSVFIVRDGIADNESIHKLDYLDMVIKETMRLFPVLPVTARETTDELQLGTHLIPKGTILGVFSYGVHRSKKYWGDDAHIFNPSRFEPENIKNVHQYAYIPFTGGPRLCIGWRYAMFFIKVYLSHFFRNYTVDTSLKFDELKITFAPSIVFEQKHMVNINKRL